MSSIAREGAMRRVAGRVEPGVSGKEKLFQQNREFGPGPIRPYPGSSSNRPQFRNDGVYRGGARNNTAPSFIPQRRAVRV